MKNKSKLIRVFAWSVVPIAMLILSLQPGRALVATFNVNSTADTVDAKPGDGKCVDGCGNCTLRAAIMEANALAGDDVITLPAGTYALTIPGANEEFNATGDLDIASNLTIKGSGPIMTTINGGSNDRVLDIRFNTPNVDISELTVTGGKNGGGGGGIRAQGTLLTLTNVSIDHNEASSGGGIEVEGSVTLNNSTVSDNVAVAGGGGGIMNYITGTLTLNNSTVSRNSAGYGGGIAGSNHGNTLILNNSTVSDNTGEGLNQQAGTVIMKNTILSNNVGGNCRFQVQSQNKGALISHGHNLSSDIFCDPSRIVAPNVSGGLGDTTDINERAAQLAPLALNSPGTTKTHALCTGPGTPDTTCGPVPSPAINNGGDCLAVDQRGVARPQGATCDIGAYEVEVTATGAACATPPPNMVAWWPLDGLNSSGKYEDLAGGDNNGTPTGNPALIPNQYVGNSLQAGIGKSVTVTDAPNLNFALESFTIDAWVKYTPSTQTEPIVYKLANPNVLGGYYLYLRSPTPSGSATKLFLQIGTKTFTGPQFNAPIGTWIFVAATINKTKLNGGTVSLYVGVPGKPLVISTSSAGLDNASSPGTPLSIGPWRADVPGTLGIDEVEIFKRALTQQPEIQSIYDAGSAGKCKVPQKQGMTWVHTASNAQNGTITVGCSGCNAAKGDTLCTQQLPVLCIYKPTPAFQQPPGLKVDQDHQWSGGVVATTRPVAGNTFANSAAASAYCRAEFGDGWRVAEFHDGWGWNFQAYGGTVSAPTIPSTRFWVHINDQPDGNCWKP